MQGRARKAGFADGRCVQLPALLFCNSKAVREQTYTQKWALRLRVLLGDVEISS